MTCVDTSLIFPHLRSFFLSSLLPPQKHPVPSDPQDIGAQKRPRLADVRLTDARLAEARLAEARLAEARLAEARLAEARLASDVTSTTTMTKVKAGLGQTSPVTNPGFHTHTEIQATTAQSQVVAAQNGFPLDHKLFGSPLEPEARKEGLTLGPDAGEHQPTANIIQHKKKKSKKERERLKDKEERPWTESSPDHKLDKLHGNKGSLIATCCFSHEEDDLKSVQLYNYSFVLHEAYVLVPRMLIDVRFLDQRRAMG